MTWRQSLIPVTIAVAMLLGLFAFFLMPGGRAGLSASAAGIGKVSQADPSHRAYSHRLVMSDSVSYTLFLPAISVNYETPVPTALGVQMYGTLSEERVSLSLAQNAKVYWVRWPISWATTEPTNTLPQNYHWDAHAASLRDATEAGLHPIVTIVNNPFMVCCYCLQYFPGRLINIVSFFKFIGDLRKNLSNYRIENKIWSCYRLS